MVSYKTHIGLIIATIAIPITIIMAIAWKSLKPLYDQTGVQRKSLVNSTKLLVAAELGKKENILEFVGIHDNKLFFKTTKPNILFSTDTNLLNGKYVNLNFTADNNFESAFTTTINSMGVCIMANNAGSILIHNLKTGKNQIFPIPVKLFSKGIRVSESGFIIRGFDTSAGMNGQYFFKGNLSTNIWERKEKVALAEGDSWGITTDGYFLQASSLNKILYMPYYKGEYFVFDTNANFVGKYPILRSKLINDGKNETISDGHYISKAGVNITLNESGDYSEGRIYNMSLVKADNEDVYLYRHNSIIDIYSISDASYIGSLYITAYKGEKMKQFKVLSNSILAIYRSHIVKYILPTEHK